MKAMMRTRGRPEEMTTGEFRMGPAEIHMQGVRSVFIVMIAVLTSSLLISFITGSAALRAAEQRAAHEEIVQQVQAAFATLQAAETGQRGFLLAQEEAYLEPYQDALSEIPARLRRLKSAQERGGISSELVGRLEGLFTEKLNELAKTIATARSEGFPAAVTKVREGTGKRKMDELRVVFDEIRREERAQLDVLDQKAQSQAKLRTFVFALVAVINLFFLSWAYGRIRREMTRRYVADLEAQRHKDMLVVSLASIGDAVIITDTNSQITFLNDVAVELTGWTREAAMGKPCAKVFRVINESSRAPVESPVDRVLATGKIVGLANHTLLLRRDGTEVPIDDSGAPVREPDGTLSGVILVFRDFSHYKTAELEQRQLRERLEAASQAKDNFFATLSHELRTPLTPVLATLSTWESRGNLPPELLDDVRMLTRNVRLEVRLIDDLLDLTRISRGQMTIHKEPVDAHALLAAVVEIFYGELTRRKVRLGVRMAASSAWVEGDPARLQQVFWNILGNAVKYTPEGGRIEIVTTNADGDLSVTFADNGRGMSEETIKGLFQPFERAGQRSVYQSGGLGIGLTISQNLVRAHGGTIEVKSGGLGLGATFTVRLATTASVKNGTVDSGRREIGKSRAAALMILLVEDHVDSATVISRILGGFGHSVDVSHSVSEALARVGEKKYDLVLSDIGLPDGSGIDFLMKAREFCSTPMIALTGFGMEEDVARYRDAGFIDQLTKPVRFDQLARLLEDFVATRAR